MKRYLGVLVAGMFLLSSVALAEQMPPEPPAGGRPDGMEMPGEPGGIGPGGMPGMGGPGGQSQPDSYDAVITIDEDTEIIGETVESSGSDENAILITDGKAVLSDSKVERVSEDSTGGDSASFYGVGAAVLVTGGEAVISETEINTDSKGGAGVFAYGDGIATVSDTVINTNKDTSGGIHVAGGGTLYASNLTVETHGESSAAIRSDRGSGTMVVNGGSYISTGSGSPAVYVTADITISDAILTAEGSEALCLEGLNSVKLYNCTLSGNMPDQDQNDHTWTIILYQSMSGDAQVGQGSFVMDGGSIVSENGGIFYTTNTESVFVLRNVEILASDDSEYLLQCTGNANRRGWGKTGANGADCSFTGIAQKLQGNVIYDSISNLHLFLTEGSVLTGAVLRDESYAGDGGQGQCILEIDANSTWVVTGNSAVDVLRCEGAILDEQGNTVTVKGADGTVYTEGSSAYTVTVSEYDTSCDLTGAGQIA